VNHAVKPNGKVTNNKRKAKLQNPPPVSTYPGASQPQISTPSYPYAAPQPGPIQPVPQTNGVANAALTLGILTVLGTPVFMSIIASVPGEVRQDGVSYVYSNDAPMFIVPFLIGSLFALSSIACGRAGQIKSKLIGGRGSTRASFGLAFGCFYFFSTFIMIFFFIWLASYH
jgi:hypothetical protein